jgi:hypothetical protein
MAIARKAHTATLLRNGKVLFAGGSSGGNVTASAELYDPETGTFEATSSMSTARGGLTATLLLDGRVLIVGGWNSSGTLASAEVYE